MIPFNQPYLTGNELDYIKKAHTRGQLAGDGHFNAVCQSWLEYSIRCKKALLTHSCTAALEIAAILINAKPGEEVIMPSYTFVSTANAFVLRGLIPVFVDIRPDTLNLDENLIEKAITHKTKAIVPVHYAGVPCEMDKILHIAGKHDLIVIEDTAQGICAEYKSKPLGSIGDIGCLSFHETKNIISGEGGALLINNISFIERAEIIRAKGTNRAQFFRGEVDKYSWQDIGSSFLPGETVAAFLFAQLQDADHITEKRLKTWNQFNEFFSGNQDINFFSIPVIPENCKGNGHIYYLVMDDKAAREHFINYMKKQNIHCIFHYIPLHNSDAGKKYGRISGAMKVTEDMASRIVRLPLWIGVSVEEITEAVSSWEKIYSQ